MHSEALGYTVLPAEIDTEGLQGTKNKHAPREDWY